MKAIVTLVMLDLQKGKPKRTGIDILGRVSTDVDSQHKSVLVEADICLPTETIKEMALAPIKWRARVSRVEIIEE